MMVKETKQSLFHFWTEINQIKLNLKDLTKKDGREKVRYALNDVTIYVLELLPLKSILFTKVVTLSFTC